jgi:hypothetical protein
MFSTAVNGFRWDRATRIPTGPRGVDSIVPAIAVRGSGRSTKLAVTYYRDNRPGCTSGCTLSADTVTSADAGRHWSKPHLLARGIKKSWLVNSQGPMFGDYVGEAFAKGSRAVSVYVSAKAPKAGRLNERVVSDTLHVG